jgi:hypothetical protein
MLHKVRGRDPVRLFECKDKDRKLERAPKLSGKKPSN